jgi:ribosomal protein L11 methyltransferase
VEECENLGCTIKSTHELLPWQNWNEEWEKQFQPEIIAERVLVRADFHPPQPEFALEIVIQPRMAFGTGHHPTTAQVMEEMLDIDFKGKSVIDMGCGTAILAILASMLGANEVTAIDNDPNAAENSTENAIRNGFPGIRVIEGDVTALDGLKADILLANINRNIILSDLNTYAKATKPGGLLVTSGYYENDLPIIVEKARENGFELLNKRTRNEWCCATFAKGN